MNSNSRGLAVVVATLGLAAVAPFAGCSGGEGTPVPPVTTGTGSGGGNGGSGGNGGVGGSGGSGGAGGAMLDCKIDGVVVSPEQCDDGNMVGGDGCESDCTFTCVKGSPGLGDEKCDDNDPCNGAETCADDHKCQPGTPLPEGQGCSADAVCKGGTCTPTLCGDGMMEGGEDCDDGNLANDDGCDADCTLSCENPATDCPPASACQIALCDGTNQCSLAPDASQNGNPCGAPNLVCKDGACVAPSAVCGNGKLEAGEDCDFGPGNGAGTGCEGTCTFSCTLSPVDSCVDAETCNGVEACVPVMVNGQVGQKCSAGMPSADCSACAGGICSMGACKPSQCGDGCVDASAGEQCEPPSTATCSDMCQTLASVVCGNGTREAGEQCDDGNTQNLDGCDAACKFEQNHRANYLKMQWVTDAAFCPQNALGTAIASIAQGQLQTSLDTGIASGSISVMFKVLGLDDLTGTTDPQIELGFVDGDPITNLGGTYAGTNSPDWWYTVDPASIDANRNPTVKLAGNINAKVLNAGPGRVTLTLAFGGPPAPLQMSETRITGTIGAVTLLAQSMGAPPGHLASENIEPSLVSFGTMGQMSINGAAKLCGNVSAASLAKMPIPSALITGFSACTQGYTAANTMLDVYVNGCNLAFGQIIKPTQPDKVDAAAPVAGGGGLYKLSVNAQKTVATCLDKDNAAVDLATCLNAAAYSSFYHIATERVILK